MCLVSGLQLQAGSTGFTPIPTLGALALCFGHFAALCSTVPVDVAGLGVFGCRCDAIYLGLLYVHISSRTLSCRFQRLVIVVPWHALDTQDPGVRVFSMSGTGPALPLACVSLVICDTPCPSGNAHMDWWDWCSTAPGSVQVQSIVLVQRDNDIRQKHIKTTRLQQESPLNLNCTKEKAWKAEMDKTSQQIRGWSKTVAAKVASQRQPNKRIKEDNTVEMAMIGCFDVVYWAWWRYVQNRRDKEIGS